MRFLSTRFPSVILPAYLDVASKKQCVTNNRSDVIEYLRLLSVAITGNTSLSGRHIPSLSPLLLSAHCQMGIMLFYILSFRNHSTHTAVSPRGQHSRELHRPQRGETRGFQIAACQVYFLPLLSLELCLPFSSFSAKILLPPPGRICDCCLAWPRGKLSPETLPRRSPGLGVGGNAHKSWVWVAFQGPHCAQQTLRLCLCTASAPFCLHVCLVCFIEKQNGM